MANNYLHPVNNHFELGNGNDLEDVDDNIFLNNSRTNSSVSGGSMSRSSQGITWRSTNPFEDEQRVYLEKRRQIEARTLESSQKSLGLLYETEEVGNATARELTKQREQLEKTSRQLDEINSTLRFSQRHLNGLKSVFGGLKNYLSGNRDTHSPRLSSWTNNSRILEEQPAALGLDIPVTEEAVSMNSKTSSDASESHLRNTSNYHRQESTQLKYNKNPFEAQLESNLEEMCDNLTRLKFLATDLGTEIESQNEMLDNMNYKIEDVDLKMTKQNKEMNKLLGKK